MEPAGPTPDEIRAKIASMPPDQQIEMIEHSPMPKDEKAQKIKEIRTKYGLKDSGAAQEVNPSNAPTKTPQASG